MPGMSKRIRNGLANIAIGLAAALIGVVIGSSVGGTLAFCGAVVIVVGLVQVAWGLVSDGSQ